MQYFKTILLLLNCIVYRLASTQNVPSGILSVSQGLDKFALNLLAQTSEEAGDRLNIALSPYTIWTLLTIIAEGAKENTLRELENALGLPSQGKDRFRQNYRALSETLKKNVDGVTLDITNAIFTTNEFPLNQSFQQISQSVYNVDVIPVDFKNSGNAASTINSYIAKATGNRIPNFVNPGDVDNAAIFITSALFFKGQWRYRFNKSATHQEDFYDESGKKIGKVQMMYQAGPYPYQLITKLRSHAIELPYGDSDKVSMIVVVPRKGESLNGVLKTIAQSSIGELLDTLAIAEQDFGGEDVDLYLPKFRIDSDLNLNGILDHLGIKDVFSAERADLLGIFSQYLYLSRVLQKAQIDVDEEGTIATAAAGGAIIYKTTPPRLLANKPFAFFIVDKSTRSILFAGKISNPNTL